MNHTKHLKNQIIQKVMDVISSGSFVGDVLSRIDIKKQVRVFQRVTYAVSLFDSGTTNLRDGNIFKFDRIVYILGNLIGIQGFPDNNDEKQGIIKQGIRRFSHYRKKTIRWFIKALEQEVIQRQKKIPKRFYVIFPLNVSYQIMKRKRHFTVEKMRLKIRSLSQVAKEFEFIPVQRLLQRKRREIEGSYTDFTYILVELQARNDREALRMANERVSLFRSICNFALSYGSIIWQYGTVDPLGKIHPPIFMFVFNNEKKFITHWFSAGKFGYRVARIQPEELKGIEKEVKYFETLDSTKLKNVLTNCLSLYSYALDQIERGYIFLNLWQILELTALKDQSGITFNKVIDRIKLIYKRDAVISDVLDALFAKRNRLVHKGKLASFSLKDVNQIRGIAEGCISFLLEITKRLRTTEALQDFYENIGLNGDRLQKKMAVINYIKKLQAT